VDKVFPSGETVSRMTMITSVALIRFLDGIRINFLKGHGRGPTVALIPVVFPFEFSRGPLDAGGETGLILHLRVRKGRVLLASKVALPRGPQRITIPLSHKGRSISRRQKLRFGDQVAGKRVEE